ADHTPSHKSVVYFSAEVSAAGKEFPPPAAEGETPGETIPAPLDWPEERPLDDWGGNSSPAEDNLEEKTEPGLNPPASVVLSAALESAKSGHPVFPVCWIGEAGVCAAHGRGCTDPGKKPLTPHGTTDATTDAAQIRAWWMKWPLANIGMRPDGLIVLDADRKSGGLQAFRELRDVYELPETKTSETQSGGNHYLFRPPAGFDLARVKSKNDCAGPMRGIDLRVDSRGYIVIPPSKGLKGFYTWADETTEIAELPRELAEFLAAISAASKDSQAGGKVGLTRMHVERPEGSIPIPDQSRYVRSIPPSGESRHTRIFKIALALRLQRAASREAIERVMRYHAARFETPLEDAHYIAKTARAICAIFPPSALAA
ncbi:MAG: bifunctional DNA primase/polymerase, partial [Methylocella sp.]